MELSSDDDDFRVISKPPVRLKLNAVRKAPASKRSVKKPRTEPSQTKRRAAWPVERPDVNISTPVCVDQKISKSAPASSSNLTTIVLTASPVIHSQSPIEISDSPTDSSLQAAAAPAPATSIDPPVAIAAAGSLREVREVLPHLSTEAIEGLLNKSGGDTGRAIEMHFSQQLDAAARPFTSQSAVPIKPQQQPKAPKQAAPKATSVAGSGAAARVHRGAAPLRCVLCGLKTGGAYRKAESGGWAHVQCAPKRRATARTTGQKQPVKQHSNEAQSERQNAFELMGAGAEAEHKLRIQQMKQRPGVTMGYVEAPTELRSNAGAHNDNFEAHVTRFTGRGAGTVTVRISQEQFEREVPCTMAYNVLPMEIAHDILATFSQESRKLRQGSQFIYDKRIIAERLSTGLYIPDPTESRSGRDTKRERRWENSGFLDLVRASKGVVVRAVRMQRENRPKPPPTSVKNWIPKRCIVNIYRDGDDHTGPHSDPLSSLGPHAIIGSLSLGAARTFKLSVVTGHRAAHGVKQGQHHTRGIASSYSLVLPHNSLLIMWEGCQENFHHSVPKQSDHAFEHHDIFGSMRVNLTFRHSRHEWSARAPQCKCGVKCNLKPVLKPGPNRGRYCWLCPSKRNESCGFFQWEYSLDGKATLGAPILCQDADMLERTMNEPELV